MATTNYRIGGVIMDGVNVVANVTSEVVNIERASLVSFDIFLDNNNAVGSITIQGTNDLTRPAPNWVALAFGDSNAIAVSSGVDINSLVDFSDLACKFIRVRYVVTSGDGLMSVTCHVKPS